MKVYYNKETDSLTIRLNKHTILGSDEIDPGIIRDYDELGRLVGIEILQASEVCDSLNSIEFAHQI